MMLIVNSLFEATFLQIKMTGNFKHHREDMRAVEIELQKRIETLEATGKCMPPHCEEIQFVPDAYLEWDNTGVHYVKLKGKGEATVAIRKAINENPSHHPIYFGPMLLHHFEQLPIIGDDPKNKGVVFYLTITEHQATTIEAWRMFPHAPAEWMFTIHEHTRLSVPTLWHGRLVVHEPENNKINLYDAFTGKKMREARLTEIAPSSEVPECSLSPSVVVRQSKEKKRKIIVSKDFSFWETEMEIDDDRLGKRI